MEEADQEGLAERSLPSPPSAPSVSSGPPTISTSSSVGLSSLLSVPSSTPSTLSIPTSPPTSTPTMLDATNHIDGTDRKEEPHQRREGEDTDDETTNTSVYVSGLPRNVDESELETIFSGFGRVRAIEVVEDKAIRQCKGFAFIRFCDMDGVFAALDFEGPIEVHDAVSKEARTIKITIADPRNELFVKLPRCSEEDAITWLKSVLPIDLPLKKFRMERMPSGESKGFGFIRFANHEEAVRALHVLRDAFFDGRRISVEMSDQKVLDPRLMRDVRCLFIKHIPPNVSEEKMTEICGGSSLIEKLDLIPLGRRTGYTNSFQIAYVDYHKRADAERMLTILDGYEIEAGSHLLAEWRKPPELRGRRGEGTESGHRRRRFDDGPYIRHFSGGGHGRHPSSSSSDGYYAPIRGSHPPPHRYHDRFDRGGGRSSSSPSDGGRYEYIRRPPHRDDAHAHASSQSHPPTYMPPPMATNPYASGGVYGYEGGGDGTAGYSAAASMMPNPFMPPLSSMMASYPSQPPHQQQPMPQYPYPSASVDQNSFLSMLGLAAAGYFQPSYPPPPPSSSTGGGAAYYPTGSTKPDESGGRSYYGRDTGRS